MEALIFSFNTSNNQSSTTDISLKIQDPDIEEALVYTSHFTINIHTALEPIPTGEPIQQSRLQPKTGVRALTSSRKNHIPGLVIVINWHTSLTTELQMRVC